MFPDTFWWGTASSATQAEGAAVASDWYAWELEGRVPRSGEGNDFATRYAEDFALLAAHGLTHHRLSIEWARVEPVEGRRDPAAIEHYQQILATARAAGINIWACLHHFTLPGWFSEAGGFVDDHSRGLYWPRHVSFCAETFGDALFGWKPINEPHAYATAAYWLGIHPPGLRDQQKLVDAMRGITLAGRDAWRELRGGGRPIATIFNLAPVVAVDESVPAQHTVATIERFMWDVGLRAVREGVLELPGGGAEEVKDLQGSCDLVGFSYYGALGIGADRALHPYPSNARVGPMGYAPWSEGLALTLRRLHDEVPDMPLLVCEHGVGTDDDSWRCDVLRDSIAEVGAAISDGIDVRGFFHWTSVDNYEWGRGYSVPFGIFNRDREPRGSAALLAGFARGER